MTQLSPICTNCKRLVDDAQCINDDATIPDPGDVTICLYCGHIMVFAEDGGMRDPNSTEMHQIAGDPVLLAMMEFRTEILEELHKDKE